MLASRSRCRVGQGANSGSETFFESRNVSDSFLARRVRLAPAQGGACFIQVDDHPADGQPSPMACHSSIALSRCFALLPGSSSHGNARLQAHLSSGSPFSQSITSFRRISFSPGRPRLTLDENWSEQPIRKQGRDIDELIKEGIGNRSDVHAYGMCRGPADISLGTTDEGHHPF